MLKSHHHHEFAKMKVPIYYTWVNGRASSHCTIHPLEIDWTLTETELVDAFRNWLRKAKDAGEVQNGAKFVARFEKNRNATEATCPPLEWHFDLPKGETHARVTWKKMSTVQLFRQMIEAGLTSASDIADEMKISKGQVSKMAQKGIEAGWLKKDGRDYALTGKP